MQIDIHDRIKEVRKTLCGGNNTVFAEKVGQKPNVTSDWMSKGSIGLAVISAICHAFPEVDLRWLITGEGEMLRVFDSENLLAIGERVNEIATVFFKGDYARMASKLSVEYGELHEVVRGDKAPAYALLNQIQRKLPLVNQLWLIAGKGEMLNDSLPMQDAIEVGYWEDLVKSLRSSDEQKNSTIAQLTNLLSKKDDEVDRLKAELVKGAANC